MKKYLIYVGILAIGLITGYFLFGGSSNDMQTQDHSEHTEAGEMWTCSMHPQIMQPEPGDCPICGMDLIPAETGADGLSANEIKMTDNAMALANIQTSIVGTGQMGENSLKLSGKIMENEELNAVQVTYFAGRIEKLYVNSTGEKVGKGQRLATIYSPELVSAQQELLTATTLKESQPELYKAVRNKLKLWKLSEKQINAIELAGKIQENFPVYANVSGVVTSKLVEEGNYVKQGQPLLKIADLNTVWAEFDAYENQLASLKKGQTVKIRTNAYAGKDFDTKITFIDPVLNSATRTVKVRTELNNKNELFKPGMFVEGFVTGTSAGNDKVTVPKSAVLWTGKRSLVYIKTNPLEAIFEMREVSLGNVVGDQYEILEGLKNGDEIVTNGTFTVDAAAQLQGKKSMMNASGGKTMTGHEGHLGMQMENTGKTEMEVDPSFEKSFSQVINTYADLKDAFIKSDPTLTGEKSEVFRKSLEMINQKQREASNGVWSILHKESKKIHAGTDIKNQRIPFQVISEKMIATVTNFKELDETMYVQFCPMANNNKGAYWLSADKKILNPYFGEAMLSCGETTQTIN